MDLRFTSDELAFRAEVVLKGYFPDLPFSEEQIRWLFEGLLALLGVDVVNALKSGGYFQ